MKRRYTLTLGAIFIALTQLYGQLDSFNLAHYKLADYKRKQLDFNFSSQLKQQRDNQSEFKTFNASGNFSAALGTYINSRTYQEQSSIQFSTNPGFNRLESFSISRYIRKSNSFNNTFNFFFINRFYLQKMFFLEADMNCGVSNRTSADKNTFYDSQGQLSSSNKDDATNTNSSLNISLMLGYGRVEPVEDARLAVYILQDLEKLNKLTRTPDEDEILEFSALISQLKNKRYFDYRLHKIDELKEVDKFLHDKGLVKDNDMAYFTAVNDNWDYSSGPARSAGSRIYAGINPGIAGILDLTHSYTYDSSMIQTSQNWHMGTNRNLDIAFLAGFEWSKPVKLYWQLDAGVVANYLTSGSLNINHEFPDTTKYRTNQFTPTEYFMIGWYPNSRTWLSARLALNQSFYTSFSIIPSQPSSHSIVSHMNDYSGSLNLNLYYYFSPQLRLTGSWNLNSMLVSNKLLPSKRNVFNQSINLGLVYSIF